MKRHILALTVILFTSSVQATEYHVSTAGLDSNPGTMSHPFKTISAAAKRAQPGDEVIVHEGVYREQVNPARGGLSETERIVYRAAQGDRVVIKGSEIVKGWRKIAEGVWKVTVSNDLFGQFNPYTDQIGGEWYYTPRDGYDRHTGAVYLNGHWLDEAPTLHSVISDSDSDEDKVLDGKTQVTHDRPLWFAEVDRKTTTIWAQFKDVNPNDETVEINVRQSIFYPDQPGRDYITVRGFTMRHAATPWSGAMSEQIGLIGTHWSRGWIIEDNVISHSMNTGITLGRYDLGKYHCDLPPATAPGFVRSCELAIEHGWSKEHIGSHIVRNNRISHCEKNAIHGSLGGIFSVIEGNAISDIAQRGWIYGPDVAGLKLLASHDVIIRGNHFHRCKGTGGLWLDWMAQGARVTGNLFHDNSRDLFMEVNHGPFLVDHNLFLSAEALRDWSQGGAYAHNLFAGKIVGRKETRKTPFFDAHSVKNMRLSDIQHRDLRFHNNLFVGPASLSEFAKDADNLLAAGNLYTAGATCSPEDGNAVVTEMNPSVQLKKKQDGLWFEMAVDPAWTTEQRRAVVTTRTLGRAKIPNAPFEQPDGKDYRLTTDYSGSLRNTVNPAPGPIEFSDEDRICIKVWN